MTNLKIIHHNIRGLNNKLNDLTIFIQENQPVIITIHETLKIKPDTKIYNYTITQPDDNKGQGICIMHKNYIKAETLEQINTTKPKTNLQHSILITTGQEQIQIATMYCPQKKPSQEILEGIIRRHKNTIITGDFNSKHEDIGHANSDDSGRTLINTINTHKYTILNDNEPTYTNDRTGKQDVKDLMFSSPEMAKKFVEFWVEEDLGSNHNIITATFKQPGTLQPRPTKTIKLYHKANWKHTNNTITTQKANTPLNNKSTKKDIDQYINKLTDTITTTLDGNITTKTIKENRIGLPKLITDMIKDKKYIRKKWQKTRIQYYKTLYNQHNKEIKRLIKIENNKNWENKCNKLELIENIDDSWKHLKQIMGTNHTAPKYPTLEVTINNVTTKRTTEQKVETLTETLEQTFTHDKDKKQFSKEHKLEVNRQIEINKKIYKPLKTIPINYKAHPNSITKTDIANTIRKANTNKASKHQ